MGFFRDILKRQRGLLNSYHHVDDGTMQPTRAQYALLLEHVNTLQGFLEDADRRAEELGLDKQHLRAQAEEYQRNLMKAGEEYQKLKEVLVFNVAGPKQRERLARDPELVDTLVDRAIKAYRPSSMERALEMATEAASQATRGRGRDEPEPPAPAPPEGGYSTVRVLPKRKLKLTEEPPRERPTQRTR